MKQLGKFTDNRNIIAHGKSPISISIIDAQETIVFVLVVILSNKYKIDNFQSLAVKL
jgi:hypothetical protein